jgi:hypothetical protein
MDRRARGTIALVLILVASMALTGCMGRGTSEGGSEISTTQVKVAVDYNGTWSGNMGTMTKSRNINGTGPQEFTMNQGNDSAFIISAFAQKSDASNDTLTISIEDGNGTVIRTQSTNAAYGVASVWALIAFKAQSGMGSFP